MMNLILLIAVVVLAGTCLYLFLRLRPEILTSMQKVVDYYAATHSEATAPEFKQSFLSQLFVRTCQFKADFLQRFQQSSRIGIHVAIAGAKVSYFADQLSQSIQKQLISADEVVNAANQLQGNTEDVVAAAQKANDVTAEAQESAQQGIQSIGLITDGILNLRNSVQDTTEQVKELNTYAQDIQSITDVIKSVAEQTNLLALNAAIEAARAGENGRGFAVVADEVRGLANKSSDSTREIEEKLNKVELTAKKTTEGIINFQQMVELVIMQVTQIGNVLSSIGEKSIASNDEIGRISMILQSHLGSVTEIKHEIESIKNSITVLSDDTTQLSSDAIHLSDQAEKLHGINADYQFNTVHDRMKDLALTTAATIGKRFEQALQNNEISESALFDRTYIPIEGSDPAKFTTQFDAFTDKVLPDIQEPLLAKHTDIILAAAVDENGYLPTHNKIYAKPLTGNYATDLAGNRTKRIFDDRTGKRCGLAHESYLLQTYKRDTGEILHDLSAPIYVNGKHWGGFRIAYRSED